MSPEQARGAHKVDHLSDQYALGLILYEMLTGRRGHPGENPFEILYNISNVPIPPHAKSGPTVRQSWKTSCCGRCHLHRGPLSLPA